MNPFFFVCGLTLGVRFGVSFFESYVLEGIILLPGPNLGLYFLYDNVGWDPSYDQQWSLLKIT